MHVPKGGDPINVKVHGSHLCEKQHSWLDLISIAQFLSIFHSAKCLATKSCIAPTRLATLSPLLHSCPQTPSAIFHHFAAFLSRPTNVESAAAASSLLLRWRVLKRHQRRRLKSPPTATIIARLELRPLDRPSYPSRPTRDAPFDRVIYYKSDLSLLAVLISRHRTRRHTTHASERASGAADATIHERR